MRIMVGQHRVMNTPFTVIPAVPSLWMHIAEYSKRCSDTVAHQLVGLYVRASNKTLLLLLLLLVLVG